MENSSSDYPNERNYLLNAWDTWHSFRTQNHVASVKILNQGNYDIAFHIWSKCIGNLQKPLPWAVPGKS